MATVLVCGAINWDTTCFVHHLPVPGEEVLCDSVSEVSGGTGANTAVAAARILGTGTVGLLGALGRDRTARRQIAILHSEGVDTGTVVQLRNHSSGHAYILVDRSGQNVIASDLGANMALGVRHVSAPKLSALLRECRCAVLTDPPLQIARALLSAAVTHRIPVLWDPGVLAGHGWDTLAPLTSNVDSLILNEAEAEQLFGLSDPAKILRNIGLKGAPAFMILKQGERGSLLLDPFSGVVTHIPPLPLTKLGLSLASTVGCGDVFLGTYSAYLSLGWERSDALIRASASAGLNATKPETRGGPTRLELESALRQAKPFGFANTLHAGATL